MSIFLIWKSNKPSTLIPDEEKEVGRHNIKILSPEASEDSFGTKHPEYTTNLNKITQKVIEASEVDPSLLILAVHLKPADIDRNNIPDGYHHCPRLQALKALMEDILEEENDDGKLEQHDPGILVNLGNLYCLRGFVVLDFEDPDSKELLEYLREVGTPDHSYFSVMLYGEMYFPPESLFTELVISELRKSGSASVYFFSLFKSGFRVINQLRLINALEKIAEENGLLQCEVYSLEPPFDMIIDYALISYSDPLLFEKMTEKQREKLEEIASWQKPFKGDSTFGEFIKEHFPRLRVIEKENVVREDPPRYAQALDRFEKESDEILLLEDSEQTSPINFPKKRKPAQVLSLQPKSIRSYRFTQTSKHLSIVVVSQNSNCLEANSFNDINSNLQKSTDWEEDDSIQTKHKISKNRFLKLCFKFGFEPTKFEQFVIPNLAFSLDQPEECVRLIKKYYKIGYIYSKYSSSTRYSMRLQSTTEGSKSRGMITGKENNCQNVFNSRNNSKGLSGLKSAMRRECCGESSESSELISRSFIGKKVKRIEDLNPKLLFYHIYRLAVENKGIDWENIESDLTLKSALASFDSDLTLESAVASLMSALASSKSAGASFESAVASLMSALASFGFESAVASFESALAIFESAGASFGFGSSVASLNFGSGLASFGSALASFEKYPGLGPQESQIKSELLRRVNEINKGNLNLNNRT